MVWFYFCFASISKTVWAFYQVKVLQVNTWVASYLIKLYMRWLQRIWYIELFFYKNKWILLTSRYVCLFVLGLSSHSRIFHSYGDLTITVEGLQILTYARHSWPLSSEDSLTCHTYCDTGHPFIMFISENPWHSLLLSVWQQSCHYLSRLGFEHLPIGQLRLRCSYIQCTSIIDCG